MAATFSTRKKIVFGLIVAAVVSAGVFGTCEGLLRLAGYGHSTRFFRQVRDAEGVRWWRENRWVTAPYFPPGLIRRPQSLRLPVYKAPRTYRVFVLGSSAAMGDPEPAFSLARQLDVMLSAAYPELKFEVVNAGITAINSHVVRVLASDCARLKPDLFIVYEGNNEVIGPYGPGTVFSPFLGSEWAVRSGQRVKATRLGQAAAALVRKIKPGGGDPGEWGGMQMFLRNEIARDDPRLESTRALFGENLRAIADAGRHAGATVFLCTVLTNQKDFAPFLSRHRAGLGDTPTAEWERLLAAARAAAQAGDDAEAEVRYREALARDAHHAELNYELGRLCLRGNRQPEAKAFLREALDLDCLRFRTDSRLNERIRAVAHEGRTGVELVDLAAEAEKLSPEGIIGDELLYEHVHLNFQGTYEMARVLLGRVKADLARRGLTSSSSETAAALPVEEVRRRLAYTTYEQAMIIKELLVRFGRAPFTVQAGNEARLKLFAARGETARRLLARAEVRDRIIQQYQEALGMRPDDWMLRRNTGMALVALGSAAEARPLLERATAVIDDDVDTFYALAMARQLLGDVGAAEAAFERVRALEPRYPGLPAAKR